MNYTIYKITNKSNNKFYIGAHSTDNLDDGYMGSGITIVRAVNKYGVHNFNKQVLFNFETYQEMFSAEQMLVNDIMIRQPDCYNMMVGGKGVSPGHKLSEETKEKLRQANLGKVQSKETVEKRRKKLLANPPMKGKKHSKESREKMSLSLKGREIWNRGIPWGDEVKEKIRKTNLGKTHSAETKEKLRKLSLGNQYAKGSKHTDEWKKAQSERMKGRKGWNKGIPHTEEHKKNLSKAWIIRRKKKLADV